MTEQISNEEKRERLYDLLKGNTTAMVTTSSDGKLVSRPMGYQEVERDGILWFFTMKDTEKAHEIESDPRVNVSFSQKGFASLSGTAQIVEDVELKKKYFKPALKAFLDTTPEDPNLILLKVEVDSAEYWETNHKAKTIVEGIKALVSDGQKRETEINQSVDF